MEYARLVGSQTPRSQRLLHGIKIIACGGMIGAGVPFPLANVQGPWFGPLTLSIFLITAPVFCVLHKEPFTRYGHYIALCCLVILLPTFLAAGSTIEEIMPWLPPLTVVVILITIVVDDVVRRIRRRPPSFSEDEMWSWASAETCSNFSLRSVSTGPRPQSVLGPASNDPLCFARYGPPSNMSLRTNTNGTDITLSSVVPRLRSHWDALTRGFFSATGRPNGEHLDGIGPRVASPECPEQLGADLELGSVADTAESGQPLLSS